MSDAEGSTIVEVCGICEYRMEFEDDGEGYGSTYEYGAL